MTAPENERSLQVAANTISDADARELRARLCPPGSIAFAKVGAALLLNRRRIVAAPCVFDNNMMAFCPREGDARFVWYWLQLVDFGQLSNPGPVPSVNEGALRDVAMPIVPLTEQRAIADFLDRKTAAIDALLEKKERLIAILEEKRQALITQVVTKGLDPDVPMKDSGIEWLGEIPAHWATIAVKRTARLGYKTFTDGDWIESPYITDEGVRLIQTGNVGIGEYREKGYRYVSAETFKSLRCTEVEPGDVLVCRLDGPVGRACLAPDLGVKMITSVDNAIVKTNEDFDARFLVYFLSSGSWLTWIASLCRVGGGFRLRISRSMLGDLKVAAPPRDEQSAIADLLDRETAWSVQMESKLAASIERLREYRQAVITAAVTGQLDVPAEDAA